MNQDEKKDKPPDIVFREYSKDVIVFVNGYGSIFHTVKATCKDTKSAVIEHRFGQDEGTNRFMQPSITLNEANQNLLTNKPKPTEQDYGFGVFGKEPPGYISYEELPLLEAEKRFRISWDKIFGTLKDVTYVWTWTYNAMFPMPDKKKQHRSLLKVVYPTKKLIFRLFVHYLYPIQGNPCIAVINPKGEETLLMQVAPVELKNEKLSFNFHSIQPTNCFKIEIDNPQLGCVYEMRWISDTSVWKKFLH
jgi:hypothetical protein